MLCGRFPFWGKTDIEYLASLQRGPDMTGDGWATVSDLGKTFLKSLLQLNPTRRLSAEQALAHPWISGHYMNEAAAVEVEDLSRKLGSVNSLSDLMLDKKSSRGHGAMIAPTSRKTSDGISGVIPSPTSARDTAIHL
jgi:serine/threonine protein kinase